MNFIIKHNVLLNNIIIKVNNALFDNYQSRNGELLTISYESYYPRGEIWRDKGSTFKNDKNCKFRSFEYLRWNNSIKAPPCTPIYPIRN